MANNKRRRNILSEIMAEPVEMPGFPQIIVTRGFIYQFLKNCGWDESDRGFSSLDYTVFGRKTVSMDLTEEETRNHYLNAVKADIYERELSL